MYFLYNFIIDIIANKYLLLVLVTTISDDYSTIINFRFVVTMQ